MQLRSVGVSACVVGLLGWSVSSAAVEQQPVDDATLRVPPRALLSVSAAAGLTFRDVSYRDRLTPGLADYSSGLMPVFGGTLEIAPAARTDLPVLRDLAAFGWGAMSLTASEPTSSNEGPERSSWAAWEAGLKWRGVFHGAEWLALAISYGWSLDTIGPGLPNALFPSGALAYVKPALAVRIPLGRCALFAGGGYRAVLRDDAIGREFPERSVGGVDLALGASVALLEFLEVRVSASYIRYFYALNPVPGDAFVAGGALDERGVADVSLVLRQ